METTFKVILFIIMVVSFIGAIAEQDRQKSLSLASICIAGILALAVMLMWL